jgi:hypothetical protein
MPPDTSEDAPRPDHSRPSLPPLGYRVLKTVVRRSGMGATQRSPTRGAGSDHGSAGPSAQSTRTPGEARRMTPGSTGAAPVNSARRRRSSAGEPASTITEVPVAQSPSSSGGGRTERKDHGRENESGVAHGARELTRLRTRRKPPANSRRSSMSDALARLTRVNSSLDSLSPTPPCTQRVPSSGERAPNDAAG